MAPERNPKIVRVASTRDPRVTNQVLLGLGEGFATFTADFDGSPAFLVDCGTMNDFLDDGDQVADPVSVHLFDTTEARDGYVEEMRLTSPGAIGVSADRSR